MFSVAPPVRRTSTEFMATSIDTMEISDIPQAVLNAGKNAICLAIIAVSSAIEVIMPLMIAKVIIARVGHAIPVA